MKPINSIQGMNDILPDNAHWWQHVEQACSTVVQRHQYRRISPPIMEKTELFARSIGADTDIVGKEMYTFEDRNGDSLTLRPECTASCVRSGIQHGLFYNQQQRFWYSGPMFRHERPQKGRYRQFHQIGVEAYGWESADIDAEVIAVSHQFWQALGLAAPQLQLNSLGDTESRARFRAALVSYLEPLKQELDADSQRRLTSNPLRILDSKAEQTQQLLADAPSLADYLDDDSQQHFEQLQSYLGALGIEFVVNPKLVRGLDYYNRTVFEWVYPNLGAQATVCAGGRYDGLVEQLGGKPTPGVGFALGVERLIELVKDQVGDIDSPKPDIYFISVGDAARRQSLQLADKLRQSGINIQSHCGDGSLKNQMKRADKSGASMALIIAEDEAANQQVTVKPMRGGEQRTVDTNEVTDIIRSYLDSQSL